MHPGERVTADLDKVDEFVGIDGARVVVVDVVGAGVVVVGAAVVVVGADVVVVGA